MTIRHYDLYDNGKGENIIKGRPFVREVADFNEVEALRRRLESLSRHYIKNDKGRRYRKISACFEIVEP